MHADDSEWTQRYIVFEGKPRYHKNIKLSAARLNYLLPFSSM